MPSKTEDGLQPAHQPIEWNTINSSSEIMNVLWRLKSEGKSEDTIKNVRKCLMVLEKNVNFNSPESVKKFIGSMNVSDGYKRNLTNAYVHYINQKGLSWSKPIYRESAKLPKIPSEEKLNMIISASPRSLALRLLISKETGLRPIELMRLKVKDIDLDSGNVCPSSAKHGSPRVLKLSTKTLSLLRGYVASHNKDSKDLLFKGTSEYYAKAFRRVRNNLSIKLGDPSIRTIRLYDFRHFYATMLYHKTKDILFTKQQMGHKRLSTTLIYTQLIDNELDEWNSAVARTTTEAQKLIESGFDYVTTFDGVMLFKKRK